MDDLEIRALTPELLDDYLYFMEHDAFGGNPDWEGCYCREGHWARRAAAADETRPASRTGGADRGAIAAGDHTGLLAYEGGKVVGWCHAEPPVGDGEPRRIGMGRPDEEVAAHRRDRVLQPGREPSPGQGLPGVLLREAVRTVRATAGLTHGRGLPVEGTVPQARPELPGHGPPVRDPRLQGRAARPATRWSCGAT